MSNILSKIENLLLAKVKTLIFLPKKFAQITMKNYDEKCVVIIAYLYSKERFPLAGTIWSEWERRDHSQRDPQPTVAYNQNSARHIFIRFVAWQLSETSLEMKHFPGENSVKLTIEAETQNLLKSFDVLFVWCYSDFWTLPAENGFLWKQNRIGMTIWIEPRNQGRLFVESSSLCKPFYSK